MNKRELISKIPIFSELAPKAAMDLSAISRVEKFDRGELIFMEGDDADALFILAEGEIDLVKDTADGRERFIRRVRPGETFAEAAMFAGDAYPVSSLARSKGSLIAIGRDDFRAFMKRHPEASMAMLGVMARLLKHWSELLSELSLSSVEARIAAWLIKRSRAMGAESFELGMQKRELAYRLGTVPATLSRNLRKLSESGAIRLKGESVIIRDIDALEELTLGVGSD